MCESKESTNQMTDTGEKTPINRKYHLIIQSKEQQQPQSDEHEHHLPYDKDLYNVNILKESHMIFFLLSELNRWKELHENLSTGNT